MDESPLVLPLRRGREIALLRSGVRHPRSNILGGEVFTPYSSILHLYAGVRWVRIGTPAGVWLLARSGFRRAEDAALLVRELLARIASEPEADAQLARMAHLEGRQRTRNRLWATQGLLALCALLFGAQLLGGGLFEEAGAFGTTLGRIEPWRYLTANLLHSTFFPPHILLNGMAILVFGSLLERSLGGLATAFVMALSGIGAMVGARLAGLEGVVGASGIASGLVGALLWLEFRRPEDLPASWRIPRRMFAGLVALEQGVLLLVPWVAVSGHLGGLAAGALAAALVSPSVLTGPAPRWLRLADAALVVLLSASLTAAGLELAGGADRLLARRGERLLQLAGAPPGVLNDTAWMIAISEAPSQPHLEVALRLAERAVNLSDRRDANILDTLAEVLFRAGRQADALSAIDEAILLQPGERYFHEQRQRFTGARSEDDRPLPPGFGPPLLPREDFEGPGIRV